MTQPEPLFSGEVTTFAGMGLLWKRIEHFAIPRALYIDKERLSTLMLEGMLEGIRRWQANLSI
jgi:hypothetical protein